MLRSTLLFAAALTVPGSAAAQQPCTADSRYVVNELYRVVLERSADRGADAFVQRLAAGDATVRQLVAELVKSSEHTQRFAATADDEARRKAASNLYRHILGREADPEGLRANVEGIRSQGLAAAIDNMLASDEYRQAFGDNGVPGPSGVRYCGTAAGARAAQGAGRRVPGAAAVDRSGIGNSSAADFSAMDRNRDGRLQESEWRLTPDRFYQLDRDFDGLLSRAEFLDAANGTVGTSGRGDAASQFDALDRNGNGRLERNEWNGSAAAFDRLDANRNNLVTRAEFTAAAPVTDDFARLDANQDGRLSIQEWNWSRRSFERQDTNGDGMITAREFTGVPAATGIGGDDR